MDKCYSKLKKPTEIGIDEDVFLGFNIEDLMEHYDGMFDSHFVWKKFLTRIVFKIVLLSNKNIVLILAGSLASVPVNILTGFYGSTSFTYFDWILHTLQLIVSVLFYIFFLRFIGHYLFIRERGEEYVNVLLSRDNHNSGDNIKEALYNIEYRSCMDEYENVRNDLIWIAILVIILVLLLFIPSYAFRSFL